MIFVFSRLLDVTTSLIAFKSSIYLESNPFILSILQNYGQVGFVILEIALTLFVLLLMRRWRLLRIAVNIFSVISIAVSLLNLYVLAAV